MKVTCKSNGSIQISLEPETPIEAAFIAAITDRAGNGQLVKVEPTEGGMALVMLEA